MCLLCIEIQKSKLSEDDIVRNFNELVVTDPKHAEEVLEKHGDRLIKDLFGDGILDEEWSFFHSFGD